MTMDDVCDVSFGERHQAFLKNMGGSDINKRAEVYDLAWQSAAAEMLDEIHVMLREALKRTKP